MRTRGRVWRQREKAGQYVAQTLWQSSAHTHISIYLSEALDESSTVSRARRKLLKRSASSSHLHARRADSIYIYECDGRNAGFSSLCPSQTRGGWFRMIAFPFPVRLKDQERAHSVYSVTPQHTKSLSSRCWALSITDKGQQLDSNRWNANNTDCLLYGRSNEAANLIN